MTTAQPTQEHHMVRVSLVVALLVALISPMAHSQRVERVLDLSAYGWGRVIQHLVDADGNPATEEWAIEGIDPYNGNYGLWRVVAVRGGGLCIGGWFQPRTSASDTVRLSTVGRARLFIAPLFQPWPLTLRLLDPPC